MPVSTSEKLTPIVPFNLLIDTDVGFIRCLSYLDNKYKYSKAIAESPLKALITLLSERKNINPLSMELLNFEGDMVEAYNTLKETRYREIISKSVQTDFLLAVKLWNNSEGAINPTILCENSYEVAVLKQMDLNINSTIGTYDTLNLKSYDPVYFKDFRDSLKCKSLAGKNIYIANYEFNYARDKNNERVLLPEISILLLDKNLAKIFEMYNKDESYEINY